MQLTKIVCLTCIAYHGLNISAGTSPVVQWLRLHASNAGGPSSIPGWETRFHMPLLRPKAAKLINILKIGKKIHFPNK